MVRLGDKVGGNVLDELFFCVQGRLGVRGESDALGNTEDMCINRHRGLVPPHGADDICCLSTYACESLQFFACGRYLAAIDLHDTLRHADEMGGFAVRVTD